MERELEHPDQGTLIMKSAKNILIHLPLMALTDVMK